MKFKLTRERKNKHTNGHGGMIIQLRAVIFAKIQNVQVQALQTVFISFLSLAFSCVLRHWFKRYRRPIVYNDVTVREHDGPLSRFYSQSAPAVWDYILSPNLIQKIEQLPVNSDPLHLWLGCLHTRSLHDVKTLTLDKQSKTIIKAWKSKLVAWTSSNADHSNEFSTNPVTVLTLFFGILFGPHFYFWNTFDIMSGKCPSVSSPSDFFPVDLVWEKFETKKGTIFDARSRYKSSAQAHLSICYTCYQKHVVGRWLFTKIFL